MRWQKLANFPLVFLLIYNYLLLAPDIIKVASVSVIRKMKMIFVRCAQYETARETEMERERKFSLAWQLDLWSNVDAMCEFFIVVYAPPAHLYPPSWCLAKGKLLQWVLVCMCVCVCYIHAVHPVRASGSVFHSVCKRKSKTSWWPLSPLPPHPTKTTFIESRKCVFFFLFSLELGNCFLMGASCEFVKQFVKFPVVILCKIVKKNKLLLS